MDNKNVVCVHVCACAVGRGQKKQNDNKKYKTK